MRQVYADDRATLWQGDALAVLRELPDASVDAVITDPPYSSGGQFRGDRAVATSSKYVGAPGDRGGTYAEFTGDNRDQRGFAYWSALWLGECHRIATDGALIMVFTDWRQLPTVTDAIQAGGWVWRGVVTWEKNNTARPRPIFRASTEFIVWGSKGSTLDYPLASDPSLIHCAPPRDREHMTEKPLPVMRKLASLTRQQGIILDPFMGSGTTGVAALLEGRRFIGVELTDHYAQVAAARIRTAAMAPPAAGELVDLFTAAAG